MTVYQVRVTHDPKTFRRLPEERIFNWPTKEEAVSQVVKLINGGLHGRQCKVYVLEAEQ